jgi:quercetin dioxygenase-like cupin family protein
MTCFLVEVTTARLETITDVCDRGMLTARVGAVLPLEQACTAPEMLGGVPHRRGKIVLNVAGGSRHSGDERVESPVGGIPDCAWRIAAGGTERPRRQAMTKVMTKVLIALCLAAATATAQGATVTPLMTQALAGIDGKEGTLIMVEYAPGGSDAEHRHHAYAFVYVLEGAVVMQVKGGKEVTLGPGQTFYESPEDVHTVSRNASTTTPAKFLVFFVKQNGAPLTVPAK